ncbi:unannotated protein [freshwater metagenome]|uniref:Unannotated protein n=1 Tax=freshwater metagenome TaxID=449393 RepID=A0A6J7F1G7_9ZZZZ|nr:hypothetical protein [Actinomycetota bacterium]
MVHPSAAEIRRLKAVAREMRDTTDESAHSVDGALKLNPAFATSKRPAGVLERELVMDAARRGAIDAHFTISTEGGGLELIAHDDTCIRTYRLKRVTMKQTGDFQAVCGAGSSLLRADPDSFFREEKWVLGFVTDDDHTLKTVIAAEIVGWSGLGPVTLHFGAVINLSDTQPPRAFTSTNEGLDGFDDEDGATGVEAS